MKGPRSEEYFWLSIVNIHGIDGSEKVWHCHRHNVSLSSHMFDIETLSGKLVESDEFVLSRIKPVLKDT